MKKHTFTDCPWTFVLGGFALLATLVAPVRAEEGALSPAHQALQAFQLDPFYDATAVRPASDCRASSVPWIYGDGQLEAWKINDLVTESFKANLKVGYEKNYGRVAPQAWFRHVLSGPLAGPLTIQANGAITVRWGESNRCQLPFAPHPQALALPAPLQPGTVLELQVVTAPGEPGALLVESPALKTGLDWEWSGDGKAWSPAVPYPQTLSGNLPHRVPEPTVQLRPVKVENGVYDFGVPVLGFPRFRCSGSPQVFPGESLAEANAPEKDIVCHRELKSLGDGLWTSEHQFGFRYLRITGGEPAEVTVEASVHPVQYMGAFACSDEKINRIWVHSAFTLRSCMQRLMLDGIRRDRMPWIGDQASNLYGNAFAFAEADIIRQSFTALGRPVKGYINGIVDYSLWWVINQEIYQEYFDDPAYLRREWPHINLFLRNLTNQVDGEGLLRPASGWVFIDWGAKNDRKRANTSLQILWWWAQTSAARMAPKAGDTAAARFWHERADALGQVLHQRAWNPAAATWQDYVETPEATTSYPDLLAVLSGLAQPEQLPGLRRFLVAHPTRGTPFMKGFELLALAQAGEPATALERLSGYWGEMLDAGATTFWEDFKTGETKHYTMYGRPYGRSLCHAWASGPTAFLPMIVFGVHPLADGWREFTLNPQLGRLNWALATLPTPHGSIEISSDPAKNTVRIPAGTTLVFGTHRYSGPDKITLPAQP